MIKVRFNVWVSKGIRKGVDRYTKTFTLPLPNLPNASHIKVDNIFFSIGEISEESVIYSYESDRFTVGCNLKSLDISTDVKNVKTNEEKINYLLEKGWELLE